LSYNFYNKYQVLLKHSYTQNASVFLKNIKVKTFAPFTSEPNFKPLYDNAYLNCLTRLNNKKVSWQAFAGVNYETNNFYFAFSGNEVVFKKNRELFLSRKAQINVKNIMFNLLSANIDNTTKNSYVYNDYLETTR